jgi:hypothetical protein
LLYPHGYSATSSVKFAHLTDISRANRFPFARSSIAQVGGSAAPILITDAAILAAIAAQGRALCRGRAINLPRLALN